MPPAELAAVMNDLDRSVNGFASSIGIVFETVAADTVTATIELQPRHMQPMGIVHGGVWATMAETLASVGAAVSAVRAGRSVVGVENRTSFIRQARSGLITGVAHALDSDGSDPLWTVEMRDPQDRLIAVASIRLVLVDSRDSPSA
jgi:1,4-dihydroxy-2-naphthoyl-CoA hydrolase